LSLSHLWHNFTISSVSLALYFRIKILSCHMITTLWALIQLFDLGNSISHNEAMSFFLAICRCSLTVPDMWLNITISSMSLALYFQIEIFSCYMIACFISFDLKLWSQKSDIIWLSNQVFLEEVTLLYPFLNSDTTLPFSPCLSPCIFESRLFHVIWSRLTL
jgi:hypothetical protein